jgi:membrane protein insertase Oxa1/YidC/SpoIIIJ
MISDWVPIFFTLCIGIPFITLTLIIAYLIYKVEKIEDVKTTDNTYDMFKEFGHDRLHSGEHLNHEV